MRGSITPERAWWNLTHYDLQVEVDLENKTIHGLNTISYSVLEVNSKMQIDLQAPMIIEKVLQNGKELLFTSEGNAHFIQLQKEQQKGSNQKISIYFSGKPPYCKKCTLGWRFFLEKRFEWKAFCCNF